MVNLKELTKQLSEIGIKDYHHLSNLVKIEDLICGTINDMGYNIKSYPYFISEDEAYKIPYSYGCNDILFDNYEVTIQGETDEIICIGAHYDTVFAGGANDNVSGVVGILYLLDYFNNHKPKHTLRFCFFVNEEPPFWNSLQMGSYVYAKMCRERNDNIKFMIALDLIGCYSDEIDSQEYLSDLLYRKYPNAANFIAVVGNEDYYEYIFKVKQTFRTVTDFPIESMLFPKSNIFSYISDHGSFSKFDYPSMLITDTAFMRYKYYHTVEDTYEKLNYEKMELMLEGLAKTIEKL